MFLSPTSTAGRARILLLLLLGLNAAFLLMLPSYSEAQAKATAFIATGAPPNDMPWEIDVDIGLNLAAWINTALLMILLATAGLWARPFTASFSAPAVRRLPRTLLLALLMIGGLGITLRLPLASRSLWWDELWSLRQCSHGHWKVDTKSADPTPPRFSPTSWKRCAFYYQKPTNHVPMSLLQKLSLESWRATTGAAEESFDDLAARWPALTASFVTLLLAGGLLYRWGTTAGACMAAAFLLAIHPMAIRYGVDARAYALVMPLSLGALIAATALMRSGGRSLAATVALGACCFLWLWAFPHGLADVVVLSLFVAVMLWRAQPTLADRIAALSRLAIALIGAAMLMLQVFLPCFLQARRWLDHEAHDHLLDRHTLGNALSQILTGLPWREPGVGAPLGEGLTDLAHVWGSPTAGVAVAVLLGIGVIESLLSRVPSQSSPRRLLLSPFVAATLFGTAVAVLGSYFYTRFWIALLPASMLALGVQMDRYRGRRVWLGWLVVLVATLTSQKGAALLQVRPIEPVHESVTWITQQTDAPRVLAYGHGHEAITVYLPTARVVGSDAEIESELAAAGAASEPPPLLIVSHISFNRALVGTGFSVFEDPSRFQEVARFGGLNAEAQHRIYRALHLPARP